MNLPKEKEPRTLRERLDDNRRLQGAMRPQSIHTYEYARAGYVERPYGAGREWGQLAAALGSFDKDLNGFLQNRLDRQIEEGVALGRELYASPRSLDERGNRLEFKAWAEAHPEEAGKNPYIVKGFEQSRLRQLGMEYQKELADFYSTGGLRNESDPAKLEAAVNQFTNEWYEKRGLSEYQDKLMLAANFSPSVAAGRANILERHSSDLSQQNLAKIKTAFQQESAGLLNALTDTDMGGFNVSHPDGRAEATIVFGQRLAALTQELALNGFPESEIPATILQMLESEAARAAEEGDEDMLDLCQTMLGLEINGVRLDKLPGAAARMERLQEQHSDKEWQRITRARTMREWAREDRARATFGYALELGRGREDINIERIIADNPQWTPEQVGAAYDSATKFRQSSFTDPAVNPQAKTRLFSATQRAIFGLDGPEALPGLLEEYGPYGEAVYSVLLGDASTFTRSEREGLQSIALTVAGLYDQDIKTFPEKYGEILENGLEHEALTQEMQTDIVFAQHELQIWFAEQREAGRTPTQADVFMKVQDIKQSAEERFRKRQVQEDAEIAAEQQRQQEAAAREAEQANLAKAQANINYLARSSGVVFDAPLKAETQAIIAPLLPENIPMPATQADLLKLLHTFYPNLTRNDFLGLGLTTRGSVYDMGLMPDTYPNMAP